MTRYTRSVPAIALRGLCAAALALLLGTAAPAATVVYRCLDAHLGVVYTDEPCKDGGAVDIRAGEADPAAVEKLERVRDALDQSAAQRMMDERRLAGQKELLASQSRPAPGDGRDDAYADGAYYTYPIAVFVPVRPHPPRHRTIRPPMSRGGAPKPPYIVPRT